MFGLGRAQLATFERPQLLEADENLDRAFDYYTQAGDVERAVAVAEHPTPALTGYVTGTDKRINRALTMVPQDSPAAGRLLALHVRVLGQEKGDYEGAGDAYRAAIESEDYVADAYCNLGILEHEGGEVPRAFDCFATALKDDPRHFESHYNLATLYFETEDLRLARLHYELAAEIERLRLATAVRIERSEQERE